MVETLFWVDIADYDSDKRTAEDLEAIRVGMRESVQRAFAKAGIPWHECEIQGTGDGLLIFVPGGVARGKFAGVLQTALVAELVSHNKSCLPGRQIKLRLALHAAEITRGETGTVGHGINYLKRLLDAKLLKEALENSPGPLGVIVSEWFFREVVRQRSEYEHNKYRKVVVSVRDAGWIRLPGHDFPPPPSKWREIFDVLGFGRRIGGSSTRRG